MRAAILVSQGKPLVIDDVALPVSLDYGQVLIRVFYSGICGSQIGEIDGVKGDDPYLPHLLGHEGSGEVVETGPGVAHVEPGDRVVLHWRKGAGIDAQPPAGYTWRGRTLNAGFVTTFNEYAVVSGNRVTPIPRDFDVKLAPLFGCAVTTGLGVVARDAWLRFGESIVVFGAGGVGLSVVQGARMTSAHPIVAVDISDGKLALAERFGATHTLNADRENLRERLPALAGKHGFDVAVNTTPSTELTELAYDLTGQKGRIVLVGVPKKGDRASINTLPLHFGKTMTGSHGGGAVPDHDIPKYIELYRAGLLKLDGMVTDVVGLDGINEAIDRMRRGDVNGRCLVELSHPDS